MRKKEAKRYLTPVVGAALCSGMYVRPSGSSAGRGDAGLGPSHPGGGGSAVTGMGRQGKAGCSIAVSSRSPPASPLGGARIQWGELPGV